MMDQQLKTLINELIEKTKKKQVKWNRTSSESKFKLILSNKSALTIDCWEDDRNNDGLATIVIFNERGDEILVHKGDLREEYEEFKILSDLQNAARNAYFNVDETISNFLNEIGKSSEIGVEEKESSQILPPPPPKNKDEDLPF